MFGSSSLSPTSNYNTNKSTELSQSPSDSISALAWFPVSQNDQCMLAASSWDKTTRIWELRFDSLSKNIQQQAKAMFTADAPTLSCAFSRQNLLFTGGCDSVVRMHNIATNQTQNIGKHDLPVCSVFFDDDKNVCISGSWDKTIRFWDCRQPNAAHTITMPVKIYAMDFKSPVLVAAGSDRQIYAYSMQNLSGNAVVKETVLRMQLRTISLIPDKRLVACGSIEGRVCITHLEGDGKNNFAFKCHRAEDRNAVQKVFPVHALDFHPTVQTALVSAGGDGTIAFWEVAAKQKLKGFENMKSPVNAARYDPSGKMLAYSLSYDWHKGYAFSDPTKSVNKVMVHATSEDMVKQSPNKR